MAAEMELAPNRRRRLFIVVVLLVFIAAGTAYAVWWATHGRYVETTDDAYVGGNLVQITPQISGTVTHVGAEETEYVKAGQVLVEMDQSDGRVALDAAEAQLALTVRQVGNLISTTDERHAAVSLRRAELERSRAEVERTRAELASSRAGVERARAELARAREDLARREKVAQSGAVSVEEVEHARAAMTDKQGALEAAQAAQASVQAAQASAQAAQSSAQAAVEAAQGALASQQALVRGTNVASHPQVQSAAARVREAYISYARTAIVAPVSGVVAKRSVQLGQRVSPGAPLMTVVALDSLWVDANFKEVQLANLRVGQPVRLHADLYGSDIDYHGKIIGFAAGTGSSFALLPPQNATGNWIKVVQRVPVRIGLDPAELAKYPLQIGLSMVVDVDTHDRSGERLPRVTRTAAKAAPSGADKPAAGAAANGPAGAVPSSTAAGTATNGTKPNEARPGDAAAALAAQRVAAIIAANR